MPFRIGNQDLRAVAAPVSRSMDGARAVCEEIAKAKPIDAEAIAYARTVCGGMVATNHEEHANKHRRIDNFLPRVEAANTYQEIAADVAAADQGVHEHPDEEYMSATFAGMHEAVTRKCGAMPVGCWRCERDKRWIYAGGVSIRHDGDRHYIVFTDASGNRTEYRIWFCPFCGKKF